MARRPVRVAREQIGGITPGASGRRGRPLSMAKWTEQMGASGAGAKEVMVKISGGGRDVDGVQAHLEYIDRHGKLPIETDHGETLQGKQAATELINEWALDYGQVPGAPHSRRKGPHGERRQTKQAFNIVLSMPAGTPPDKVLAAAKKFAREEFAHQHRYAMALHAEHKDGHGKHPHVHLVVKAEHEYGGARLNPRKADLRRWRERFAEYLTEQGVAATATRRHDRGLVKSGKKTAIFRAAQRVPQHIPSLRHAAGDSTFMHRKLEGVRRDLERGQPSETAQYQSLLNVRAAVDERYREAIERLRAQGREAEARRFELMHKHLSPVRTENQLIADAMLASRPPRAANPEPDHGRAR